MQKPTCSLVKIAPFSANMPSKPNIIYDLSIINNEYESNPANNEISVISSSSQGTINNFQEENGNNIRNNQNHSDKKNNAILIHENYCVAEEKKDKLEPDFQKTKKNKGVCFCNPKKSKEKEKIEKNDFKAEILYKNEIYNINNENIQNKNTNTLYKISDYLDQMEYNDHEESNPSNSTRNDEQTSKNPHKINNQRSNKDKCIIF